jgi:hypothetical protein
MFRFSDLFQWDRFVTPSIIKTCYGLIVLVAVVIGVGLLITAIGWARLNPVAGGVLGAASIIGTFITILAARIAAEFVLITFRISEHLGAMRSRMDG